MCACVSERVRESVSEERRRDGVCVCVRERERVHACVCVR